MKYVYATVTNPASPRNNGINETIDCVVVPQVVLFVLIEVATTGRTATIKSSKNTRVPIKVPINACPLRCITYHLNWFIGNTLCAMVIYTLEVGGLPLN